MQKTNSTPSADATVNVQPLPDKDGVIITVQPPKGPVDQNLSHVPCDIALVIDVSGSMGTDAPVPGEGEDTGLSVLDLVKHSCTTIMSTMTTEDRLAIVTFSNVSKVLQPLTAMTDENKEAAKTKLEAMNLEGSTNLWHGLKNGIKLFEQEKTGRVPAVMVLTDGLPNHMCPPQGYIPALKALGKIVPSIHTFGFGYTLRSGLLKSISEFGKGNYSFIPDAGMIGTVFVHAVANFQSTFANDASLYLTYPDHVTIQQTTGASVDRQDAVQVAGGNYQLPIPLGNIQYGQSRDIYLQWKTKPGNDDEISPPFINVTLQYSQMTGTQYTAHSGRNLRDISFTTLSDAEIAYHISRSRICAFIADLFPIDPLGEHRIDKSLLGETTTPGIILTQIQTHLHTLLTTLPATHFPADPACASLLQDLAGPEPLGQVTLALSQPAYLSRWGQHYLPSLQGAHARQLCNSFKDPGPQRYGAGSPLFVRCRDALSGAFDDLPAPAPSDLCAVSAMGPFLGLPGAGAGSGHGGRSRSSGAGFDPSSFSMSSYNFSSAPCFSGDTMVRVASGGLVRMASLRKGVSVATPLGPREVVAVLVTPVCRGVMVWLGGVLVTPWHPVALSAGENVTGRNEGLERLEWVFPAHVHPQEVVRYTGTIYSVLLQRGGDVDAHAIFLGGGSGDVPLWGVTLGHGMTSTRGTDDVRAHGFFGSYDRVARSLAGLGEKKDGRVLGGGVRRSKATGLVDGFKACRRRGGRSAGILSFSGGEGGLRRRAMV